MQALDNLNSNIASLTTTISSVQAYITTLKGQSGESETSVQAAADAVASADSTLKSVLPTN